VIWLILIIFVLFLWQHKFITFKRCASEKVINYCLSYEFIIKWRDHCFYVFIAHYSRQWQIYSLFFGHFYSPSNVSGSPACTRVKCLLSVCRLLVASCIHVDSHGVCYCLMKIWQNRHFNATAKITTASFCIYNFNICETLTLVTQLIIKLLKFMNGASLVKIVCFGSESVKTILLAKNCFLYNNHH